jgi:hypothetical protein
MGCGSATLLSIRTTSLLLFLYLCEGGDSLCPAYTCAGLTKVDPHFPWNLCPRQLLYPGTRRYLHLVEKNFVFGYRKSKKKVREFPVPSRDVTTKLSLGGNNDVIT